MNNLFLIIPEKGTKRIYYIKPVDIINLIQDNDCTRVTYKCGDRVVSVETLLTGQELHEELRELDKFDFNFVFGDDE